MPGAFWDCAREKFKPMTLDRIRDAAAACGVEGLWLEPGFQGEQGFANVKGAYLLLLRLPTDLSITLPNRPEGRLRAGDYVYCGSARGGGGIAARLKRHFRQDKKLHWHVDRLTTRAAAMAALAVPEGDECRLATQLLQSGRFEIAMVGFGSSDCRQCKSHLLMTTPTH